MTNSIEQLSTKSSFLPKVSVIIPIYNGEKDLPDLINCLRSQTYPHHQVEYLLVNNNSSDRTSEILEKAVIEMTEIGIKIKALNENKIQSSYAARNKGIRHSTGEILAFTDADCRPLSNWIEELVQPFMDETVGIVVGELTALPGESLLEKYAESSQLMAQKFLLEHPFFPYGQTANLAIRKKIFQEVGLFRPYLTTGGDADICWRIQQNTNWKIAVSSQGIIRHRHRSTLKELQSQFRRYGESNRYLHDLYGVDLMTEFTLTKAGYYLGLWLFKDIPKYMIKLIIGKAIPLDFIKTPIDLVRFQARSQGQKEAKLPENAKEIEWL